MNQNRFPIVDEIRGFAIILMIFFHLFFDLDTFHIVNIDFSNNWFWWILPRIIVFLFFLSVGLSLGIAHFPSIQWKKFWKRFLKIAIFALIISMVTFFLYPDKWIYFGTLHSIALCSLLAIPFLGFPFISLMIFLGLFIPSILWDWNFPWFSMDHYSLDYISPFPWVGAITLGIFLFHKDFHKLDTPKIIPLKIFGYLGKYAFPIYLLHQPILFSLVWISSKLIFSF